MFEVRSTHVPQLLFRLILPTAYHTPSFNISTTPFSLMSSRIFSDLERNQHSLPTRPLTNPQTQNASNRYRLRLHRARSVVLSPSELVEIRAAQRTFEGAYIRTSLSQFSFALIVLKIFTAEFYAIGKLPTNRTSLLRLLTTDQARSSQSTALACSP